FHGSRPRSSGWRIPMCHAIRSTDCEKCARRCFESVFQGNLLVMLAKFPRLLAGRKSSRANFAGQIKQVLTKARQFLPGIPPNAYESGPVRIESNRRTNGVAGRSKADRAGSGAEFRLPDAGAAAKPA